MDKAPDAFRTISEVADDLDVPQHVLRFWETRFPQIKPMKRGGGRRYYRPDDVDLLRGIRHLLYGEGYTIRGVQRLMKDNGARFIQAVWRPQASAEPNLPHLGEPREGAADPASARVRRNADVALGDGTKSGAPWPRANKTVVAPVDAGQPQPSDIAPSVVPIIETVREAAGFSREEKQSLQAVLDELTACLRLLDEALKEE